MSTAAPTADLTGWAVAPFTAAGRTHDVYRKGSGPGVVLVPEIPGATPEVIALGDFIVGHGFTVAMPSPFGEPGRPFSAGYALQVVPRLCVSSEFRAFATGAHRPIADYLRGLAADLAASTPGPGVGVIGMCFTGGFALAAAVDDSVLAAVLSQPAVPFPVGKKRQADPGMSEDELTQVVKRTQSGALCALGLRFSEDPASRRARFDTLSARLGDAFEIIELDSSPGNAAGFKKGAHQVLTNELREVPGHPAHEARNRMAAFLVERLQPGSTEA